MVVYALGVATAVAATAFRPAQMALLPQLATHPAELTAANVASSTIESVGFFAGPAVAGVLLAVADVPVVFGFNALTFLWSAGLVALIRKPEAAKRRRRERRTRQRPTQDEAKGGPPVAVRGTGSGRSSPAATSPS